MSTFTQYADHAFIKSNYDAKSKGKTATPEQLATMLVNHAHALEILEMCKEVYRPEDLPSNGSTEGYMNGYTDHAPSTADLAEQAEHPTDYWQIMMLAYQANIIRLARWVGKVYNPETKEQRAFNLKLEQTKRNMRNSPRLRKSLQHRWELLKMCNKALR